MRAVQCDLGCGQLVRGAGCSVWSGLWAARERCELCCAVCSGAMQFALGCGQQGRDGDCTVCSGLWASKESFGLCILLCLWAARARCGQLGWCVVYTCYSGLLAARVKCAECYGQLGRACGLWLRWGAMCNVLWATRGVSQVCSYSLRSSSENKLLIKLLETK